VERAQSAVAIHATITEPSALSIQATGVVNPWGAAEVLHMRKLGGYAPAPHPSGAAVLILPGWLIATYLDCM